MKIHQFFKKLLENDGFWKKKVLVVLILKKSLLISRRFSKLANELLPHVSFLFYRKKEAEEFSIFLVKDYKIRVQV